MWLEVIKVMLDIGDKRKEMQQSKRLRISEAFANISRILKEAAEEMQRDLYPSGKCVALRTLAEELMEQLRDHVKEDEWHRLAETITRAASIEAEYANRHEPETIAALHEAAGFFEAKSIVYKI